MFSARPSVSRAPLKVSPFAFRRRRRLQFLLAVLDAPSGVRRPEKQIKAEINAIIAREFGPDA